MDGGYWVKCTKGVGGGDTVDLYVNLARVVAIKRYSRDGGAVIYYSGLDKDFDNVRDDPDTILKLPRIRLPEAE